MFTFFKDIGNYEERKVGRDVIDGLVISTAYSSDEGYETAVIDNNGVYPVERYNSKTEAEAGHKLWCEKAKTISEVTELGWSGFDETHIVLERMDSTD